MSNSSFARYEDYQDSEVAWIEQIPAHWSYLRIKDLSFLQSGNSITAEQIEETGEYPVYGGNGLRGYYSAYTNDGYHVLIGRQGALCGNINYARGKFWASEHAVVVYQKPSINTRWYGEMLRVMNLNQYSLSAAQPGLSVDRIKQLMLPVPPLDEQKAIADYLDSKTAQIDRKIDLLAQKADKYRELRQTLINETVTRGLDKTVPLKNSGVEWIGKIPVHWEVKRLKAVNTIVMGQSPPSSDYTDEGSGYPFLQGNAEFGNYYPTTKVWSTTIKKHAIKNDILLSVRAPVGEVNIASDFFGIGRGLCAIRSKSNFQFWYYFLRTAKFHLNSIATGSTYLAVSVEDVKNMFIPLPPPSEQKEISDYLDEKITHIDQIITTINNQIEKLHELRKTLINDVVTGQIKVF